MIDKKIRHSKLGLVDIFDTIEDEKTLEVQKLYFGRYSELYTLFAFYFDAQFPKFLDDLDYRQPLTDDGRLQILSSIPAIINMLSKDDKKTKNRLEGFMECLSISEMMFMENFFSKSLEEVYPNIDWEFIKAGDNNAVK